jgi:hypothetical protein
VVSPASTVQGVAAEAAVGGGAAEPVVDVDVVVAVTAGHRVGALGVEDDVVAVLTVEVVLPGPP